MTARRNVKKSTRAVDALLGLGYLALAGVLVLGALAVYGKVFADTSNVVLETGSVGNALQKGSDVKLNGVPVGQVRSVAASAEGADVELALDPDVAKTLPTTTTARLLPKTLFGERYVSLVVPAGTGGEHLATGGRIRQDRSDEAIELEQVFDELLPVLKALKPHKLQATLAEMAAMLRGQGTEIGDSMSAWAAYFDKLNPSVPTMTEDFQKLANVAGAYDEAMPDLLEALDQMRTTSATLVDQQSRLKEVYASVIAGADETEEWVDGNRETIVVLADKSRKALGAVKPYATQFPCLLKSMAEFVPVMDKTLGKGTSEPGIHVNLKITEQRGAYRPGKDKVTYATGGGPRCPYTTGGRPSTRKPSAADAGTQAATPRQIAAPPSSQITRQAAAGLGDVNSPAENQLIAELMAPGAGLDPEDYPSWGSLLVGPSLRGTEVTLS